MKNFSFCVLVAALFLLVPNMTFAGYSIKKTHTVTVQQIAATNSLSNTAVAEHKTSEAAAMINQLASPSFVSMLYNGTVGVIAFFCGILGFFAPLFAIAAIMLGFMGLLRKNMRNRGLATLGLILGLVAILISIFGGFAPLPVF
jgi:hypothetical protein